MKWKCTAQVRNKNRVWSITKDNGPREVTGMAYVMSEQPKAATQNEKKFMSLVRSMLVH